MCEKKKKIKKEEKKSLENKMSFLSMQIEKINTIMQKSNIHEMLYVLGNKKEIIKRNFLAGIFRGIGIGIGITVITAILIILLQKIVTLNIPIIGEYISDIVDIVQKGK